MADPVPSMSFDGLLAFLEKIDIAVRGLRTALEANDMDRLPNALELTNLALDSIYGYPGGVEKLKGDIKQFPEGQKEKLVGLLNETSTNHQINGDLIRLAMQRSAAMQSVQHWVSTRSRTAHCYVSSRTPTLARLKAFRPTATGTGY
jgi:hypothetical protein